jgi:DNA-binding MarR family transcriptional regulator
LQSDLEPKELATTRYLHEFMGEVMRLLSAHFEGQTTLNDLRIGNYIGLLSQHQSKATSNKNIAEALDIPPSTVSRIVKGFVEANWVTEYPHPEDGRKKLLHITPDHARADGFEKSFRIILNELLKQYDDGKLVHVCPEKKSF